MWRLESSEPLAVLAIEATNASYHLPDKGLAGPHAIFDPAMLDVPRMDEAFRAQQSDSQQWRVKVKRRGAISTITYPFNPLDAVGWHGDLTVARINVKDIRPLMSHRYHLPPSAHTTFVGNRFVVCTFVPRPFETDPGAIKIPFFHNNDDFDEVIFYHAGNFFSRDNINPGMVTLHPAGFTHGPHPKALNNMLTQAKTGTDEYAVMIDARDRARDRRRRTRGGMGRLRRQLEAQEMKLASRKAGGRDGQLVVVDCALTRFVPVPTIAPTMQAALDNWVEVEPQLREVAATLAAGKRDDARPFDPRECAAPLPRAYHWVDGSAYVNHVELVRKARGARAARFVLDRSARLPGRLRRFSRPLRRRAFRQRGARDRSRGGSRGHHR